MQKKEYVDSFLNETEKLKLQQFADDEQMQNAVKKVLLAGIYQNGTLQKGREPNPAHNFALSYLQYSDGNGIEISNEQVGANIRACFEGLRAVENAYKIFEEYKTPEEPKSSKNQAR